MNQWYVNAIPKRRPVRMWRQRWLAKLAADLGGYFWLQCPICKEPFAGFEWGHESLMRDQSSGEGVCAKPECQSEAARRNRALYDAIGGIIVACASAPPQVTAGMSKNGIG